MTYIMENNVYHICVANVSVLLVVIPVLTITYIMINNLGS